MKLDFAVIGASRSGTTWLHDNLSTHPELYLPNEPSEPHFFSKYYDKGIEHYEGLFERAEPGQKWGEVTPDYIYSEDAPARIKRHFPDVKIILSVRNPIDRLYSMHWVLRDKYTKGREWSFEERIEQQPQLIGQGHFYEHLKRYMDLFPREQIKVIMFDDIVSHPEELMKGLYRYLDVDDSFESPYLRKKVNRSRFMKHESKYPWMFKVWRVAKKFRLYSMAYRVEKLNSRKPPEMDPETRKRLAEHYRPHNQKIATELGLDISDWD